MMLFVISKTVIKNNFKKQEPNMSLFSTSKKNIEIDDVLQQNDGFIGQLHD